MKNGWKRPVTVLFAFLLCWWAFYLRRHWRAAADASACANAPAYTVYKADRKVLKFHDCPGYLMSRAVLPPGRTFPRHPFVNAQSLDAAEESRLSAILAKAGDLTGFVAMLKENGYRVEAESR